MCYRKCPYEDYFGQCTVNQKPYPCEEEMKKYKVILDDRTFHNYDDIEANSKEEALAKAYERFGNGDNGYEDYELITKNIEEIK